VHSQTCGPGGLYAPPQLGGDEQTQSPSAYAHASRSEHAPEAAANVAGQPAASGGGDGAASTGAGVALPTVVS
jgi:hypothetical protein